MKDDIAIITLILDTPKIVELPICYVLFLKKDKETVTLCAHTSESTSITFEVKTDRPKNKLKGKLVFSYTDRLSWGSYTGVNLINVLWD